MKLLGWILHRKFRQNSSEQLEEFGSGKRSLDDQHYLGNPSFSTETYWQAQKDHLRKSFAGIEAARVVEREANEESAEAMSELFHGFLAIGTLGSDPSINDPSTPPFSFSVENITEKETEVTESELKLINDELEKVLGSEVTDDVSGRNSHVSNGRSSYGSTITLDGKILEVTETSENGAIVCPLQGYLLSAAVELSETTTVAKKESRTSLGELFQKTKMAEDNNGGKYEKEEKRIEKEADKGAVHIKKKNLKKKICHASTGSATASGGTSDSLSGETKLHKILHMFHKKVHPASSTSEKRGNPIQTENKKSVSYDSKSQIPSDEGIVNKGLSNLPQLTLGSDENGNKECWIKTDADYLVLEL